MATVALGAITGIYWQKELTSEEKHLDGKDFPIFEVIDDMSKEDMEAVDRIFSYKPESLGHYNNSQMEWFRFENEHRDNRSLVDDILERKTYFRYKLWYIVSYPERIEVRNRLNGLSERDLSIAENFLISVRYNQVSRNLVFSDGSSTHPWNPPEEVPAWR